MNTHFLNPFLLWMRNWTKQPHERKLKHIMSLKKLHYVLKEILDKKDITIFQVRLEFLKYEIRNFSMQFAKLVGQSPKEDTFLLENKLEKLETATTYIENLE